MPMTQQHKQHEDTEQHNRERLKALIGKQVRHTLGEPDDLLKVQKGDHEEITDQMGLNVLGSPAQAAWKTSYQAEQDTMMVLSRKSREPVVGRRVRRL